MVATMYYYNSTCKQKLSKAMHFLIHALYQGIFISQMKWAPFKNLFWNTNESVANLIFLLQAGVSLLDRPCY